MSGGTIHAITTRAIKSIADGEIDIPINDSVYRLLIEKGLNENMIKLIERYPNDHASFVQNTLDELSAKNLISSNSCDFKEFLRFKEMVESKINHTNYTTFIFPEEALLLYAIASIQKIKNAVFLGSYYGYWSYWVLQAVKENNGQILLVDIDSQVLDLAIKNIQSLGFGKYVDAHCLDATAANDKISEIKYDLVVIDAEGPKENLRYGSVDKALYHDIAKCNSHILHENGLLIFHNMLLSHQGSSAYFDNMIENNKRQFYKLIPFLNNNYSRKMVVNSTEGVG
ncbi:MAG: O-methyltransferase, partial [bacterium]